MLSLFVGGDDEVPVISSHHNESSVGCHGFNFAHIVEVKASGGEQIVTLVPERHDVSLGVDAGRAIFPMGKHRRGRNQRMTDHAVGKLFNPLKVPFSVPS